MQRTFDDFDRYASDYRTIHNQNIRISGADSDYFSRIKVVELMKYEQNTALSVLDLGCGDGKSAEFFSTLLRDCSYHGIDISAKSIDAAAQKNLPGCHFQTYDGAAIPFADGHFDIVYIACVFHHIDFKLHAGILKEALRVLKKGGRIYLFEHNPYNPVTRKIVRECPFDQDAVLLSPSYARGLFKAVGFRELKLKYFIFFPRHAIFRIFHWLENYIGFIPAGAQYYLKGVK